MRSLLISGLQSSLNRVIGVRSAGPVEAPAGGWRLASHSVAARSRSTGEHETPIGREREIADLSELIWARPHPLVTVVGPAGVGKTTLANAVADEIERSAVLRDGVQRVDLTALDDPSRVLGAIADACGVTLDGPTDPIETLRSALAGSDRLLLLDNFEHVIGAAIDVASLLDRQSKVVVLTTSRMALGVSDEQRFALGPLGTPAATELFRRRARSLDLAASLDDIDALSKIAAICEELDGLPLAIELAAARLGILSLDEIFDRLAEQMELLSDGPIDAPARQRSMRAAIGWSYDAADVASREMLRDLAVLRGTFSSATVAALGADDWMSRLSQLIEHGFVHREGDRFRVPETVRQFASSLQREDERIRVMGRLVEHLTRFATEASINMRGADQQRSATRMEVEAELIRAALAWAIEHDPAAALRLANATTPYWTQRGNPHEGANWFDDVIAVNRDGDSIERATAFSAAGHLREIAGESDAAVQRLDTAAAMFERCGDWAGLADVELHLGNVALNTGQLDRAQQLISRIIEAARTHGDERREAGAIFGLGTVAYYRRDLHEAERQWQHSLRYFRRQDDSLRVAILLSNLGAAATEQGHHDRSAALLREALDVQTRLGDQTGAAATLANLGETLLAVGDLDEAEPMIRRSIEMSRELRLTRSTIDAMNTLARVLRRRGRIDDAVGEVIAAFGLGLASDNPVMMIDSLEIAASLMIDRGRAGSAAQLIGTARRLRTDIGEPVDRTDGDDQTDVAGTMAGVRQSLSAEAIHEHLVTGEGLSLPAAADLVHQLRRAESLAEASTPLPIEPAAVIDQVMLRGLTPREIDVLRLLARRYTDREIATELFISVRTVTTHVARILDKLGVDGRRQAAAEATRLGLVA
ncbi:MAG: tetratricopeptide repeat protein [Ilumatobacteraceae bacterium]|nr:tetratricopeptide repeat protein [Ilumatobacteraceae bacterium]